MRKKEIVQQLEYLKKYIIKTERVNILELHELEEKCKNMAELLRFLTDEAGYTTMLVSCEDYERNHHLYTDYKKLYTHSSRNYVALIIKKDVAKKKTLKTNRK